MSALAEELLALIAEDDATRARLASDGSLFEGYHPEMEAVHRANAARLDAIVAQHGWPGAAMVGAEAASAAWRVLQHAIGEPVFLRRMLPIIAASDADRAEVAMLEDRIAVYEGRAQRYGTQVDWDETLTAMVPMVGVDDPDHVDERRAAVGLPPIVWRQPVSEDERAHAPASYEARQAEGVAWARARGWRS